MKHLDDIEVASRDEITALQVERLKSTLEHVYRNVPHYRHAFDEAGVQPSDLTSLEDLAKFPFTTKNTLRENYPFGMFAVPREQVVRIHASSGTTGKPTVVGYTKKDLETWAGVIARSIVAGGGRPGQIAHNAAGYGLFTGGLGFHYGAERLGCTVVPISGGGTERQVQLICDFKPELIHATPSYMLALADEFQRQSRDSRSTSLKVGFFGGEPWTTEMRREIEDLFAMEAIDLYGLSEVMGPGVACECIESKDGPVIWEDHFYPEIIDPETGAVLPDGEEGELVFTSLTKEAMPVIRYRTRDITSLQPPTSRSMRRVGKVLARTDDMLIIRGVNVFPSQIEEILLQDRRLSGHYYLEIAREGRLDTLTVHAEVNPKAADTDTREDCAHDIKRHIKERIGVTAEILVRSPGSIDRSQGKAKRVVDLRKPA